MIVSQVAVAKKYAKAYLNVYQDSIILDDISHMCEAASFLKKHNNFMLLICAVGIDKEEAVAVDRVRLADFALFQSNLASISLTNSSFIDISLGQSKLTSIALVL